MNCLFDDIDLITSVKPLRMFCSDNDGYFIEVCINKTSIVDFMKNGISPVYDGEKEIFKLRIRINNATIIRINGLKVNNLDDSMLRAVPNNLWTIRELKLHKYSHKTKMPKDSCYATRLILRLKGIKNA